MLHLVQSSPFSSHMQKVCGGQGQPAARQAGESQSDLGEEAGGGRGRQWGGTGLRVGGVEERGKAGQAGRALMKGGNPRKQQKGHREYLLGSLTAN